MTNDQLIYDFQAIENAFNEAVISNNTEEISKCIADDWVLVDARGGIIKREDFYYAVQQGLLSHTSMTKEILRVKVYNDIAMVPGVDKIPASLKASQLKQTNRLLMSIKNKIINGFAF